MKKLQDDASSSYATENKVNIENNIAASSKGTSKPQYKVVYQIIRDFEELCYSSNKCPKIVKHINNCNPHVIKDQFSSNEINNSSISTNKNGIAKYSGPSRESDPEEIVNPLLINRIETEANTSKGAKIPATSLEQIYRETKTIHGQFSKLYKYSKTAVFEDEIESIYEKQSEYFEKISKLKMFLSLENIDNNIVNVRAVNFSTNEASVKVNSIRRYKTKTQENIISSSMSSNNQSTVSQQNDYIKPTTQGLKITSPVAQFGAFLVDNGNKEINQWKESNFNNLLINQQYKNDKQILIDSQRRESTSTSNKCDMLLFPSEIKYNKIKTNMIKTYTNRRKSKLLTNLSSPKTPSIDKYKMIIKNPVSVPKKIEYQNPTSPWNNINFEKYNLIASSNQKSHTVIAMPHFKKKIILNLPFKKRSEKEALVIKKPKYYTFERYDYLSTGKSKLPAKNNELNISRENTIKLNSEKRKNRVKANAKRPTLAKSKRKRIKKKSKNITKAIVNSIENYIVKDKKLLSAVVRIPKLNIKKKESILEIEKQTNTSSKELETPLRKHNESTPLIADNEEIQVISGTSVNNNKIMTLIDLLPIFNYEMNRFFSRRNIFINPIATRIITEPFVNTFKVSLSMLFNYFSNQTTSTERFNNNDASIFCLPVEFTEAVANVMHSFMIYKFQKSYPNKLKFLNNVELLNLRKLEIYNNHITSGVNKVIEEIDNEMTNATIVVEKLKTVENQDTSLVTIDFFGRDESQEIRNSKLKCISARDVEENIQSSEECKYIEEFHKKNEYKSIKVLQNKQEFAKSFADNVNFIPINLNVKYVINNKMLPKQNIMPNEDVVTFPKKYEKGIIFSMTNEDNTASNALQKRKLQSEEKKFLFPKLIKKQKIETFKKELMTKSVEKPQ